MKNCQFFICYLYIKYCLFFCFNLVFKIFLNDIIIFSGMVEKLGGGVRQDKVGEVDGIFLNFLQLVFGMFSFIF